ncbi:hypothetical protein HYU96_04580 [Candidatus Daviesbacteria bacterium]|nr:hypothetical protein [Candidatus Daviesbacteria bacterium]
MDENKHKKVLFNKIYANIPLGLRDEIVVVLENNEPLSWNAAKIEIDNDTDKVDEILDKLNRLGLLKEHSEDQHGHE